MATVNTRQIKKFSEFLKQLPDTDHGINFYSYGSGDKKVVATDMYPPLYHPEAINFFFFVCLHQYGFWHGNGSGYEKPLIGVIDGKESKGSDLLWKVAMRAFNKDRFVFDDQRLANIDPEKLLLEIFTDDNGIIPFHPEERFRITRNYGEWFRKKQTSPLIIVQRANESEEPLKYFLGQVRQIAGYNQDPFEKKNLLLAMTLANRPEKFLHAFRDPQNWSPIVDYHLMRVSLRLGLVDLDENEQEANKARSWVSSDSEYNIRSAVHSAVTQVIAESGRSMSFVDQKMWMARRYCPEMTEPDCPKCVFTDICKKRTELFQPVFHTTAY